MTAKSALSASVSNECVLPDNPEYLLSLVRMELDNANINKFVSFIDLVYMEVFLQQYHGFATGEGYLLGHKYVIKMCGLMKILFPFVHLVIAMTVSSPCSWGEQVDLSPFFDCDSDYNNDDYCNSWCENKDINNDIEHVDIVEDIIGVDGGRKSLSKC